MTKKTSSPAAAAEVERDILEEAELEDLKGRISKLKERQSARRDSIESDSAQVAMEVDRLEKILTVEPEPRK